MEVTVNEGKAKISGFRQHEMCVDEIVELTTGCLNIADDVETNTVQQNNQDTTQHRFVRHLVT